MHFQLAFQSCIKCLSVHTVLQAVYGQDSVHTASKGETSISSPDLECPGSQNSGSLILRHVDGGSPLLHWNGFPFFYKGLKMHTCRWG